MNPLQKIEKAQKYLRELHVDGWLLYDFAKNNDLAYLFLDFPENAIYRRRFFYWIPKEGEPIKIVHAIESHILDKWPGEKRIYSSWQMLQSLLRDLLKGMKKVAMEYSPGNAIPYVSKLDAGTADSIRSFGPEIISSASFLPFFTAVLDEMQAKSAIDAGEKLDRLVGDAWKWIGERLKKGSKITEYDVQQKILADFQENGLVTDSAPNVSVNAHTADPHYEPKKESSSPIRKGDFLLIDMWAKQPHPGAVFGDITRVATAAEKPTEKQREVFKIVRAAQLKATELVVERFRNKKELKGYEVDDAARQVIVQAGYGPQFTHRTGHNIGVHLHGSGAHMDNLEMHDVRPILLSTCFSIEPGIYLEGDFGIRLEYDLYVDRQGHVVVIGGEQDEIATVLQ